MWDKSVWHTRKGLGSWGLFTKTKFWYNLPREAVEYQSLQNPVLVNAALGERVEVVDYMISEVLFNPNNSGTLYSKI